MKVAIDKPAAQRLLIEYYTDPLCGRSWVFEPYWQRLRAEFGHQFAWRYQLSGLLSQATSPSYLACLAVQCAERQSQQAGNLYLCALREAALSHGRNIAQREVLMAVADELATQVPGLAQQLPAVFDAAAFRQNLTFHAGAEALRADGRRGHYVQPVPMLVLRRGHQPGRAVALSGQPYEVLLHELARVAPDLFYVPSLVEGGAG